MNKFLKVLVVALCAVLLVVGSVAATLAYLSMKTEPVKNTFTSGDINITLKQETLLDTSKMMPGMVYTVDPVVTVLEGSESCWLFIKIEESPSSNTEESTDLNTEKSPDFDTFLSYTVAEGWTALPGVDGVYYRSVDATSDDANFQVIANNTVYANDCTKDQYNHLRGEQLTLSFTAYAVQSLGFDTAADAWVEAEKLDTTTETESESNPLDGKDDPESESITEVEIG